MTTKRIRGIAILFVILASFLACNFLSGRRSPTNTPAPTQAATQPPAATAELPKTTEPVEASPTQAEPEEFDTEFPLPEDVDNFIKMPNGGINYQTGMTMDEVIAFYREAFTQKGLTERTLLTVIEETTFSMVFDGSPNGMALVIQGVSYGPTGTNVNIRYEDV